MTILNPSGEPASTEGTPLPKPLTITVLVPGAVAQVVEGRQAVQAVPKEIMVTTREELYDLATNVMAGGVLAMPPLWLQVMEQMGVLG